MTAGVRGPGHGDGVRPGPRASAPNASAPTFAAADGPAVRCVTPPHCPTLMRALRGGGGGPTGVRVPSRRGDSQRPTARRAGTSHERVARTRCASASYERGTDTSYSAEGGGGGGRHGSVSGNFAYTSQIPHPTPPHWHMGTLYLFLGPFFHVCWSPWYRGFRLSD